MIEAIVALALLAATSTAGLVQRLPALSLVDAASKHAEPDMPSVYLAVDRSVSNWRDGTRRTLEPVPLAIAAAFLDSGRPVVTRCVRLNNPWCIKRARWSGELGGDDEGHTAFESTAAGADAAASLLRTYHVTYGHRSALDIVRRWAPAECRIGDGSGLSAALAVRGLANTLRGRFLASRGRTGTAQPRGGRGRILPAGRVRVSAVPLAPMPSFRVPDLAPGMGERPSRLDPPPPKPAGDAAGRSLRRAPPPARLAGAPVAVRTPAVTSSCGSDEGRIRNYAQAMAKALGVEPSDNLLLFDGEGQPTANLLPVMVAMSAIELGYLHAGPELVEGAIARLRARIAQATLPPEPPPAPPAPPAAGE